ncbi:DUF6059 family protein [Streptomyces jeddahensis]|uniref:Uncharacterized protein n=1 Tax=Streptomyces jeddahensis TaxID=1716141 RepID=A0A177HHI7_9ACTN|nr:DUF6059 family protein [Streptomyces jeddahensis]OAH09648.1 hypothetical protein STSP_70290 [Streptomyces jeddahensis]
MTPVYVTKPTSRKVAADMSRAAGVLDPLYSRGLTTAMKIIDAFAALSRGALLCGTRCFALLYEGLQAAGSVWVHPLPPEARSAPAPEPPRRMLDTPPDGHPERLCPHTPPSPDEIDIWTRLHGDP